MQPVTAAGAIYGRGRNMRVTLRPWLNLGRNMDFCVNSPYGITPFAIDTHAVT